MAEPVVETFKDAIENLRKTQKETLDNSKDKTISSEMKNFYSSIFKDPLVDIQANFEQSQKLNFKEKKPGVAMEMLDQIRAGVDGMKLGVVQRLKDSFTNLGGLFPNRAAQKRAQAADLAQTLMQADIADMARSMGDGAERQEAIWSSKGAFSKIASNVFGGGKDAAAKEAADKQLMGQKKMRLLAEQTAENTSGILENTKKSKMKKGLGIAFALILAPIVALMAFFDSLKKQLKALGITKSAGKLVGKIFGPIGKFFRGIMSFFKEFTIVKKISGFIDTVKKGASKVLKPVFKFFDKLAGWFKSFSKYVKGIVKAGNSASGILRFAKTFGSILGKIFLPITTIIAAFDFFTGASDAWKASEGDGLVDRVLQTVFGGLKKMVQGLIGVPLDLLKSAISWVAEKLGFEEFSKVLDNFSFADEIGKIFDGVLAGIQGAGRFIKDLFSWPADGGVLAGVAKLIDILTIPLNLAINFIRGLFGFDESDPILGGKDTFSLGTFLVDTLKSVFEWMKGLFDIDFKKLALSVIPDWAPDFIKDAVGIGSGGNNSDIKPKDVKVTADTANKSEEVQKLVAEKMDVVADAAASTWSAIKGFAGFGGGGNVTVNDNSNKKGGDLIAGQSATPSSPGMVAAISSYDG